MIEEISDKSRTPNRIFSKQVNNFNSIPSVPSVPNVTPKDPNDFVEEFTSEPFGSLTIQGILAHNSYSSKYQSISGRSDVEAPALVRDRNSPSVHDLHLLTFAFLQIRDDGTSFIKGSTVAFYEGPRSGHGETAIMNTHFSFLG